MMNLGDAGTPCGCMDARIARGNQIQISGLSDIFTVLPAVSSVIGHAKFASFRNYLYFQTDIKTRGNIFKEVLFHLCAGSDVYVMPIESALLLLGVLRR